MSYIYIYIVKITGQQGSMKLRRVDRFGNSLVGSTGELGFLATAKGPDDMVTQVVDCGDGTIDIRCRPITK